MQDTVLIFHLPSPVRKWKLVCIIIQVDRCPGLPLVVICLLPEFAQTKALRPNWKFLLGEHKGNIKGSFFKKSYIRSMKNVEAAPSLQTISAGTATKEKGDMVHHM